MPFATLPDGAALYYESHGEGPPLVLCTGLGGLAAFWADYVPDLARSRRVIVYDHRGTGQSTISLPPYSVDDMADDLIALLDHLAVDRVDFCGHSTGGAIGQLLGSRYPDRVGRLLLAATWGRRNRYFTRCFDCRLPLLDDSGAAAYFAATSLLIYPPSWIAENFDRVLQIEAASSAALTRPDILKARIAAICAFDATAEAAKIAAPTMIVAARDDMTTALFMAEELSRAIPGARLKVLDWGGHMFPLTDRATFGGILRDYLAAPAG